eukprot:6465911-Amphidinium_carterae.1
MHEDRAGPELRYCSTSVDELEIDPQMFSLAFVNAATHKVHLDRMLELNVDCVCMAETNHTDQDSCGHRYVKRGKEWERVNFHWSPAVRKAKDQRTRGRASAGVLCASSQKWTLHDLTGTVIEPYSKEGRICVTKLHYCSSRFAWIVTLYAHVDKDAESRASNQKMLTTLYEYLAPFSREDVIIVGDFNMEFPDDLASILATQTEAY